MRTAVPYYFEQWPRSRWDRDVGLMKRAGISLVRMAEFAWSVLEPAEGKYDFSLLDEAVSLFASNGFGIILGTPGAAYPPWLHALYPDIHQVRADGRIKEYGMRQDACRNHAGYRRAAMALTAAMADRYARDGRIFAWQIDNELGCHGTARCFCPNCEREFRLRLEELYGDTHRLNEAWGTSFWSQRYDSFDEVSVPRETPDRLWKEGQNPGLLLAFARFSSDVQVRYLGEQADLIRRRNPGAVITHNLLKDFVDVDYSALAEKLDVVSWDNYPFFELRGRDGMPSSFPHAFMHGLKRRPVWVMEQAAGPGGWDYLLPTPEPGRMRLWAMQSVARGADLVCFFRWRSARFGMEQYWHGILPHHGEPGRRFNELADFSAELEKLSGELEGSVPAAEAAILFDQDTAWSLLFQPQAPEGFDLLELCGTAACFLDARAAGYAVVRDFDELKEYRAVIAPTLHVCTEDTAGRLASYVENGGLLVLGPRSGIKDGENAVVELPPPGHLRRLAGAGTDEFDVFGFVPGLGMGITLPGGRTVPAHGIAEALEPGTGNGVLAVYGKGRWYEGRPAVTIRRYGKGACVYLGTILDAEGLEAVLGPVYEEFGLVARRLPDGVETAVREKNGARYRFYLNHRGDPAEFEAFAPGIDLLSGERVGGMTVLAGLGVFAVKEE